MATRSKNKFLLIAWILLFTFGVNGVCSAVFLDRQREYFKSDYFQTMQFVNQLDQFTNYLGIFELNKVTEEEAKKAITVTQAEIEEHRSRYGNLQQQTANIRQQYETDIHNALADGNKQLADFFMAERDKKIDDITNNFKSDEHVRPKVIKEKEQKIEQYFRQLENYRSSFLQYKSVFKYHIKNTETGDVFTNLDMSSGDSVEQQLSSGNTLFVRSFPASSSPEFRGYGYPGSEEVSIAAASKPQAYFEGQIAILKSTAATSPVMDDYYRFKQTQRVLIIYTFCALISLLVSFYLFKRLGIKQAVEFDRWAPYYSRIPLDVRAVVFAIAGFATLVALVNNTPNFYGEYYPFVMEIVSSLFVSALFVVITYITGKFLIDSVSDGQRLGMEWQNSLLYRAYRILQEAFMNRSLAAKLLTLLVIVYAFGGAAGIILAEEPELVIIYAPVLLLVVVPILVMIMKRIGYFNRIVHHAAELAVGNFERDLPVTGRTGLASLAGSINKLKHGVKVSQKEQAKSERLKTELITNVSHDLRTPLTSIITYTELLKKPDLPDEDREAYIQIIDRKSKRLKVLIDDLFEASKMASGNIELVKEKADLVQLLQQALAEHNEAINDSTLLFRVKTPPEPIYATVDGQRLWRVFDNLIGNILKYSLEHTRVHISIEKVKDRVQISFKNVTKYELSENVDELFERFKRGDTSRHTDGSGLGLAIAKSIVDLHGGSLQIEVDGDLFKVTVLL